MVYFLLKEKLTLPFPFAFEDDMEYSIAIAVRNSVKVYVTSTTVFLSQFGTERRKKNKENCAEALL